MQKQTLSPAAEKLKPPWVNICDVSHLFGMSNQAARNALNRKTFPVPTYKVGKLRVIDRDVLTAYFDLKKAEGMTELRKPKKKKAARA